MHEWEQSTIEAKHVIKPLTVEGQTILDPFMGYGNFGVSYITLKRKFIGIEIDKEHYSRAVRDSPMHPRLTFIREIGHCGLGVL